MYVLVGVQNAYLDESAAWFEPIILAPQAEGDEPEIEKLAPASVFTVIDRRLRRREKQQGRLHDAEFEYNLHFGLDRQAEHLGAGEAARASRRCFESVRAVHERLDLMGGLGRMVAGGRQACHGTVQ